MSNRLSGIPSRAYLGTNAQQPPNCWFVKRNPTSNDDAGYSLMDFWLNTLTQQVWILASLAENPGGTNQHALWLELSVGGGPGGATDFVTDVGTAVEVGGIINILGDANITTRATPPNGDTVSITLNDSVSISGTFTSVGTIQSTAGDVIADNNVTAGNNIEAGNSVQAGASLIAGTTVDANDTISTTAGGIDITGPSRLRDLTRGVVQSSNIGNITSSNGTDGQVLIASTGFAPEWNTLTAGQNITITEGAGTITIDASGGGGTGTWTLIETQVASNDAEIVFTSFSSTYNIYVLLFNNVTPSSVAGPELNLQYSNDGGATYKTTLYNTGVHAINQGNTSFTFNQQASNRTILANVTGGISSTFSVQGVMWFTQMSQALVPITDNTSPNMNGSFTTFDGTNIWNGNAASWQDNRFFVPMDAIRIYFSAGNIAVGTFSLYGIAQ